MRRVLIHRRIPFTFIISPKLHFSTFTAPIHLPTIPISRSPSLNSLPNPLKQHLLSISHICPSTSRKFIRSQDLKAQDLLEILENFHLGNGDLGFNRGKVESLWRIFDWVLDRNKGFGDGVVVPRCYEIMGLLLLRVGMVSEVEVLVSRMEFEGILVGRDRILSGLIGLYVDEFEAEKAVLVYEKMGGLGLEPALACYRGFLRFMIEMDRREMMFRVVDDILNAGIGFGDVEAKDFEDVIRVLCRDGKVQQARKLVKKAKALGLETSSVVLNEIGSLFCYKKDFDDLVSFFGDMGRVPDCFVCNKAIHSICGGFGIERAYQFLKEVKQLGFCPNEATFGILICWSCHYGKLRNAFIYFSETISNGMSPNRGSYNALMSGLFKEGMWQHAREVLNEMIDNGIQPDMVTYKLLLSGFCKARKFGEVKTIINDMVNNFAIRLAPLENPLSRAFLILGLDAKVKRDNNKGSSMTEFYDDLGNGLYLETDLDKFEQVVSTVLEESMIPDFNRIIVKECELKNMKAASLAVDEMFLWGQEFSLSAFTALAKSQCVSCDYVPSLPDLLNRMPKLIPLLEQEVLTSLLLSFRDKDFAEVGSLILKEIFKSHQQIENSTYSSLMLGICKTGEARTIRCCWALARKEKWLPELKDSSALLDCLCQMKMRMEAIELFRSMLASHPHSKAEICNIFLEKLCSAGYTVFTSEVINTLLRQGFRFEAPAYMHLFRGYCREKRVSEALKLFDDMFANQIVPCPDTLELIIPLLCRAKRAGDASVICKLGLKEHCSQADFVYNALISGCCRVGEVAKASALLLEMLLKQLIPTDDVYNVLFQGHCKIYDLKKVGELLCAFIRKTIPFSVPSYRYFVRLICEREIPVSPLSFKRLLFPECGFTKLAMFNILIFHLFRTGSHRLVDLVLDEMQRLGLHFDEVTFNFLIYGYATCKRMTSSMQYLNTMISNDLRPSNRSLREVACYFYSSGEVQKALDLSKEMESRGWAHSSVLQNLTVDVLLSAGRFQEAESFLARMEEKGLTPDRIDYNFLIWKFCSHGKLDAAFNLLNVMLKKGSVPDSASYDALVYSSCIGNKLDQAMDLFNEMLARNLSPAVSTWDVLAGNLCRNGQTFEAERLLVSMVENGLTPTRRMYCSIVDGYCSENNLSKALEIMEMMQRNGYEPDFRTHWYLISNMWSFNEKKDDSSSLESQGFLSKLLSDNGFSPKKGLKANVH